MREDDPRSIARDRDAGPRELWKPHEELRLNLAALDDRKLRLAVLHHARAAIDGDRRLSVWDHHLVNVSRNRYRLGQTPPESTETYGLLAPIRDAKHQFDGDLQPTLIPN